MYGSVTLAALVHAPCSRRPPAPPSALVPCLHEQCVYVSSQAPEQRLQLCHLGCKVVVAARGGGCRLAQVLRVHQVHEAQRESGACAVSAGAAAGRAASGGGGCGRQRPHATQCWVQLCGRQVSEIRLEAG